MRGDNSEGGVVGFCRLPAAALVVLAICSGCDRGPPPPCSGYWERVCELCDDELCRLAKEFSKRDLGDNALCEEVLSRRAFMEEELGVRGERDLRSVRDRYRSELCSWVGSMPPDHESLQDGRWRCGGHEVRFFMDVLAVDESTRHDIWQISADLMSVEYQHGAATQCDYRLRGDTLAFRCINPLSPITEPNFQCQRIREPATSGEVGGQGSTPGSTRAALGSTLEEVSRWRIVSSLGLQREKNVKALPSKDGTRPLGFVPTREGFEDKVLVVLDVTSESKVIGADLFISLAERSDEARWGRAQHLAAAFLEDLAVEADRAELNKVAQELRRERPAESEEAKIFFGKKGGFVHRDLTATTIRVEEAPFFVGMDIVSSLRVALWLR